VTASATSDWRAASHVRLDGFHALKHAVRFGAVIERACTDDIGDVTSVAEAIAPDLVPWLVANLLEVTTEELRELTEQLHSSRVVAFAHRPPFVAPVVRASPVVLLEAPRHLSNLGATIRVAAAANAAAVVTTGVSDPWHPVAVRTSAGLHFALPVRRYSSIAEAVAELGGQLIGVDPDGDDIRTASIPTSAVLCFGTERAGLSDEALGHCSARLRLPMRPGVSSLNLATSVAVVLYHLALADGGRGLV
jgi:RNA methyltransferase, TrmH family